MRAEPRGGFELVYRDHQECYSSILDALTGPANLSFSLGVVVGSDGNLSEVLWESPALEAGMTVGTQILAVNRTALSQQVLSTAVAETARGQSLELLVKAGQQVRVEPIAYDGG